MLEIQDLSLELYVDKTWKPALRPLTFRLEPGEITGIIGESGSGKSLLAKALMNILPARARVASGSIRLHGTELLSLPRHRFRSVYGRQLAYIFQNPAGALNPLMRIGDQLLDALLAHEEVPRKEAVRRALKALDEVGISDPERVFRAYPHEISGGMKQRAVIACAVIHEPDLLIADEATTALDATIRKQILDLFLVLSKKKRMSILYISHDIAAVQYVADKIMVLYGGMLLETGARGDVLDRPLHPYTADLLQAVPYHVKPGTKLAGIPGNVPPITAKPPGCIYAPRCGYATERCKEDLPPMVVAEDPSTAADKIPHTHACFHPLLRDSLGKETHLNTHPSSPEGRERYVQQPAAH
ncbi:ABC transporter ATP-binding protein [Paenibacillus cisolokensis]|uniref:ABC transporter ATP-binding protein n=1 Tax=Paenibacillus cisolokensis TaxID=1658519 RepID=UPI003D2D590D